MKYNSNTLTIAALIFSSSLMIAAAQTTDKNVHAEGKAEAHAEGKAEGGETFVQKQTVTSDGNRTIKKTTTIRNGVEETVTEITDAQGNVVREGGAPGNQDKEKKPTTGTDEKSPWLGVKVADAPAAVRDQLDLKNNEGVVIEILAPNSPASKAGLRVNDLILKLNQTSLGTAENLRDELRKHQIGETVNLEIIRKGARSTEAVVLEENTQKETNDSATQKNQSGQSEQSSRAGDREMKVEVQGGNSLNNLDDVLNNPQLSEEFKKSVRDIKKRMEEHQKSANEMQERVKGINGKTLEK